MRAPRLNPIPSVLCALLSLGGATADAGEAPAATRPDAGNALAAVAPFVDEQTLAVVRVDLSRIDARAIESWAGEAMKGGGPDPAMSEDLLRDLARTRPAVEAWLAGLTRAGARDLYVVVSLADLPGPPALVVPAGDGADADAIEKAFNPSGPAPSDLHPDGPAVGGEVPRARRVGRAIVMAPAATQRRLRDTKPADRPDLAEALSSAGDAPFAAALALTPDARRVIEELQPQLPPQLGGGPSTAVTRGARWVAVALRLPPEPSLTITVRASDADSAKALAAVVNASRKWGVDNGRAAPEVSWPGGLVSALAPVPSPRRSDELVTALGADALRRLVAEQGVALQKPRRAALSAVSTNNMKQLLLGCVVYADGHKGEWPEDLEKAVKDGDFPAGMLVNPARPDSRPGYTYLNPGRQRDIRNPAATMVLYETEPQPGGRNAGFADGHVEFVDEARFQKYLAGARGK